MILFPSSGGPVLVRSSLWYKAMQQSGTLGRLVRDQLPCKDPPKRLGLHSCKEVVHHSEVCKSIEIHYNEAG